MSATLEPVPSPGLALDVQHDASTAVIVASGELEFATAPALRSALIDLAQQRVANVILDLSNIEFIDSTGISLLVQAKQRFDDHDARFALRAPHVRVVRVLEIAGLASLFDVES